MRLAGWAHVAAGVRIEDLGYDPDAEKAAIAKVLAELTSLGFAVDDRQTAGVGYDLLARHTRTGEQRCVEVKGHTGLLGPVWLEQNEWAQALQRGNDYWLYVVDQCGTTPTVRVRTQDPASVYGIGGGTHPAIPDQALPAERTGRAGMTDTNARLIDRWFPVAAVDEACGTPAGSGRIEKAIFTWFASRPIAQARAAALTRSARRSSA